MTTKLRTALALAATVAVIPVAAGPADAATKHKKAKPAATKTAKKQAKRAAAKPKRPAAAAAETVPTTTEEVPASTPTPVDPPAPAFNSVISIGGFVFYNVSYADAVAQYEALIASGVTPPPPVTSISVTTTVGSQ